MSKNAKTIAVIDCETQSFKYGRVPKPYVWGFYDGDIYKQFFHTADLAAFLSTRSDLIVYAHNGGKFDFHFLLEWIEPYVKVMIIDGRLVKCMLGGCELRDSYAILPIPLAAYKKDDFDYSVLEDDKWELYVDKISTYLKNDCVYLYEIIKYREEMFGRSLTLASSAMDTWAKKFYKGDKPKSNRAFFDRIRPYYYGGRVECFKKGIINANFSVHDIKSAYPYAMGFEHPWGHMPVVTDTIPTDGSPFFVECFGVAKGCFPHFEGNALKFPADDLPRTYFVTGWEWNTAAKLGVFTGNVISVTVFKQTINFKEYVSHFYDMKAKAGLKLPNGEKTDPAGYLLAKLYMNSLYGKFGQDSSEHEDFIFIEHSKVQEYLGRDYDFCGECGKYALMSKPIDESLQRYFNLATAASITGFVRAYLFEHIHNSKGVMYCDTDSIACEQFVGVVGEDLGQWEKEGDFDKAAIGGKKLYAFRVAGKTGWEEKSYKKATKGARLTAKEIFDVADGKKVLYKNIAPTFSLKKSPSFVQRTIQIT